MNLKLSLFVLFFAADLALFIGCEGRQGVAAPETTAGSMKGKVFLAQENTPFVQDRSGVIADANGMQGISTIDGSWEISDIKTGIYHLTFSKQGYCTAEINNYIFAGNGIANIPPITLVQKPSFQIASIEAFSNETEYSGDIEQLYHRIRHNFQ